MKSLVSIIALAVAIAFTGAAFAGGSAKTKAQCEAAGGVWDAASNSCKQ